jgi:hypothetical protein
MELIMNIEFQELLQKHKKNMACFLEGKLNDFKRDQKLLH